MKDSSYSCYFTSEFWWRKLLQLGEWVVFVCFSGVRLKFSCIAMSRKRLQRESKLIWPQLGFFPEFSVGICLISLTSYLHGLKFAWISRVKFFLTTSNFFDSLSGILVCSLNMLVRFSHGVLQYWLKTFSIAMQAQFLFFASSSLALPKVVMK